jgi:hypothetical protein
MGFLKKGEKGFSPALAGGDSVGGDAEMAIYIPT